MSRENQNCKKSLYPPPLGLPLCREISISCAWHQLLRKCPCRFPRCPGKSTSEFYLELAVEEGNCWSIFCCSQRPLGDFRVRAPSRVALTFRGSSVVTGWPEGTGAQVGTQSLMEKLPKEHVAEGGDPEGLDRIHRL